MVVLFASLNLGEYPDGIAELFSAEGAIIEQRGVTIGQLYKNDKLIYN